MNDQPKGHCKHGEFILAEGCPECIAEHLAAQETNPPVSIVKVRYIKRETGEPEGREYSYFTAEPLGLDFHVKAPTQYGFAEAVVTALDVPEAEIAAFRDRVKIIPAGSIMVRPAPDLFPELNQEPEPPQDKADSLGLFNLTDEQRALVNAEPAAQEAGAEVTEAKVEITYIPPALATIETQVRRSVPGLFALYQEAASLLQFAKKRVIAKNEDLKPATDDLAIIAKCKKGMFERKNEIVGPLKTRLDAINQAFDDLMFPVLEADRLTRLQVTEYDNKVRAQAAEAKRIEDEKFKLAQDEAALTGTGEHTQELGTAVAPPAVPAHTRTDMGTLGGRDNWKARVVDFKLLDDHWKIANESLLNAHARSTKGERPIPGVEFWNDRIVTVRVK